MDIDTARLFTEKHPGFVTLVDTETRILSGSKAAIADVGYKSVDSSIGVSYYDFPVRAKQLAQYFHQTDKELMAGVPCIHVLVHWYLNHNKRMLALCEKIPIKDKNDKVIAILAYNIDITRSNLIDISRYFKLFNHDKHVQGKVDQFFCKIYKNNHDSQENLSTREMECLFYMLRGKTVKGIGEILQLSFRTVEDHITNIKRKFNVIRKPDLIEKAIMRGYMNVLPQSLFVKAT